MKVLNIHPKDVHVVIELSLTEIVYILEYLSVSVANPDRSGYEKFNDAKEFIEKDFFPGLDKLTEHINNEFGPDGAQS